MIRQFVVSEVQTSCQTKRKKINEYICELGLNTSSVTLLGFSTLKPRTENDRQRKENHFCTKAYCKVCCLRKNEAHILHQ